MDKELLKLLDIKDISLFLDKLDDYLSNNNKNNYYDYIIANLQLDVLNNDYSFKRFQKSLYDVISNNDLLVDENFFSELYQNIEQSNKYICNIYLNILDYCEDKEFYDKIKEIIDKIDDNDSEIIIDKYFLKIFDADVLNHDVHYQEVKKYIFEQRSLLDQNDNFIRLDKSRLSDKEYIKKVIRDCDDINIFYYGDGSSTRMILKKNNSQPINFKKLLNIFTSSYKNREYFDCIDYGRRIIENNKSIKPFVLFYMGMSYVKNKDLNRGLQILRIADDITYKSYLDYHYTDIITNIINDHKIDRTSSTKLFDRNNSYGLKNIEKISKLVKDNNNDVLKVCDILNLTDRETCFVLLICARDSFIDEDYDKGNKYLKIVEKRKNRTKSVNSALSEISSNKRFYKSRGEKKLILASNIKEVHYGN